MFLQGGEFAFVLYTAATAGGVIDSRQNAVFATVVILSMALTPLLMIAAERVLRTETSMDGVDDARDLKGRVLIIGFGRFGQIASQLLLAQGVDLSVIDNDQIRSVTRSDMDSRCSLETARGSMCCIIPAQAVPMSSWSASMIPRLRCRS